MGMTDKVILIFTAVATLLSTACASPQKLAARRAPRPALSVGALTIHAPAPTPIAPWVEAAAGAKTEPLEVRVAPTCRVVEEAEPAGLYRTDPARRGKVVLTFDDGPYVDKTPAVLDLLSEHELPATFFVLGRHITAKTYSILQRMEREGHTIASHSYDHDVKMAHRDVSYIRGQHEAARILIELALLAESPEDFEAMHVAVFDLPSTRRLPNAWLGKRSPRWRGRHQALLDERGLPDGRYAVRYSRPPGGGPFLGTATVPRARYGQALAELGMLNVMWHSLSGDVDATRARDHHFLKNNLLRGAQRGGVLLVHDFIRPSALAQALSDIAADPTVEVIDIERAISEKYGCATLRRSR